MKNGYDIYIRHVKHYNGVAYDIGLSIYWEDKYSMNLEMEWEQIKIGWDRVVRFPTSSEVDAIVIDYTDVLLYLGKTYEKYREIIPWLQKSLEVAKRLSYEDKERNILKELADIYIDLGESKLAISLLEDLLMKDKSLADWQAEASTLESLGDAYLDLDDMKMALAIYEHQLTIARENGSRPIEGRAFGRLGNAYNRFDQIEMAIEYHQQELMIMRELGDLSNEQMVLNNLGNAYSALGDVQIAIKLFEQSLAKDQASGNRYGEAISSWNLGHELVKHGDVEQGLLLMKMLVDYEQEIKHLNYEHDAALLEEIRQRLRENTDP